MIQSSWLYIWIIVRWSRKTCKSPIFTIAEFDRAETSQGEVVRWSDQTVTSTLSRNLSRVFGGQCKVITAVSSPRHLQSKADMLAGSENRKNKKWQSDFWSVFRLFLCSPIKPDVQTFAKYWEIGSIHNDIIRITQWLAHLHNRAKKHLLSHSVAVFSRTRLTISLIFG